MYDYVKYQLTWGIIKVKGISCLVYTLMTHYTELSLNCSVVQVMRTKNPFLGLHGNSRNESPCHIRLQPRPSVQKTDVGPRESENLRKKIIII